MDLEFGTLSSPSSWPGDVHSSEHFGMGDNFPQDSDRSYNEVLLLENSGGSSSS